MLKSKGVMGSIFWGCITMMIKQSRSVHETEQFAREIGEKAVPSQIYCLKGELGSGKTAFARGFARGLGIDGDITSPTFGIINEYYGTINLYHFDVYRINSLNEMEDTGYEEYFYSDGVCLIEWADMIKELIPSDAIWVHITKIPENDDFREIRLYHSREVLL